MANFHFSVKPSNKQTRSANAHARYICRDHALYIAREGKSKGRDDLQGVFHVNMPKWAASDPNRLFWASADKYERSNGRVYNELEFSLPRELGWQERQELARSFAAQELGESRAYTLAFHGPKALDGKENPHAHLMFSERLLDGIERPAEGFFKRYNPKEPELGGARKERLFWRREEVEALRERWAGHVNRALARAGVEQRVDHRSLKRQGIEREAEPKMGPVVTAMVKEGKSPERFQEVIEIREYRALEAKRLALEEEIGQERAKVYEFAKEREKRAQDGGNSFSFGGEKREVSEEEKRKYRRTVDLVLSWHKLSDGDTEYRWKRSGQVAFVDRGAEITYVSITPTAVKAGLQVAKEKGWEAVVVTGSEEFRRESWLQAKLMGIKLSGYEPTAKDQQKLVEERAKLALKKAQYERERAQRNVREYPAKEIQAREAAERGLFADSAERLVARFREEILPKLERERRELWAVRKELGLELNPADIYRQEYVYPATEDPKLLKAREEVEKRFERVKTEIQQAILLQRSLRELGKERVVMEWTAGKRSLKASRPDELEQQIKAAREIAKVRSRGRGIEF